MLKSHEKFYSENGKRLILVVDDEMINRELMGAVLEQDYEVIYAENGEQAMELILANQDTLSLVLLDLMMPVMSGKEVLSRIKASPLTRQIPVIVLTADQNAEIETLGLGATDFILKPYPEPGVIQARVLRTIELSEDRQIILSTERDPLTGLYNRDYFYSHADQYDHHHKGVPMDAIVVDVNHFHMINERFGIAYGDKILRRIGEKLRNEVFDVNGIVCRREADTFMVYCPHGKNYKKLLEGASQGLDDDEASNNRIRLRMGVYEDVDKTLEIERRFDRAKMAADTVRNSFTKTIGMYDKTLHERELYAEQLIEDFPTAIAQHQFVVWFQPKFDIRPKTPTLASAEALVRWQHPTLGMINPGIFIPLFEDNGLIQELDNYVWRTTAQQIREWKDRLGFSVPISVNVSRIDMYDPMLLDTLQGLLEEHQIDPGELLLEITESAYTQESEQIVSTVNKLRALGFHIEMDDFGTGYSSLNMISTLPIDALKLDMQFIRTAFSGKHDTRMLEVIIDIADYLKVPVIAEGVETEVQLRALKAMGCDLVQGYYFSRPVPAHEFEHFVVERKDQAEQQALPRDELVKDTYHDTLLRTNDIEAGRAPEETHERDAAYSRIAEALAKDYLSIYYVNVETEEFVEYVSRSDYKGLGIQRKGTDFFALSQENMKRVGYKDDLDQFLESFTKENVMRGLEDGGTFAITYRLVLDGRPTYMHLKATRMADANDPHIVLGVSNIDAQIRREQARASALRSARKAAYHDPLTGVKSKLAYAEREAELDESIRAGKSPQFAVMVSDVNDLKVTNDTLGHAAGDELICSACHMVCNIFAHSPVFRYGGDEFVAILHGSDYEHRHKLMNLMAAMNAQHARHDDVIVACGLAEYEPLRDRTVSEVFERADKAMYDNKRSLKKGAVR